MAHDVFISYSAKYKTTADAVCAMLESEGIRCWIAPRDVVPGMEWGECIIEAIEQTRVMVLVFTAHADASPQIRREVERAVNHGVAILPLRIEDIMPGRALEYFIGNVHWLDALTPPLEAHLKSLAGTVKMLLDRMSARDAPTPGPAAKDAPEAALLSSLPQYRRQGQSLPRPWLLLRRKSPREQLSLLAVRGSFRCGHGAGGEYGFCCFSRSLPSGSAFGDTLSPAATTSAVIVFIMFPYPPVLIQFARSHGWRRCAA